MTSCYPETLRPLLSDMRELADVVRAMPIVLRVEKAEPPARTPLLEAAASAALAVCLDDRTAPDGPWHEPVHAWIDSQIRKVTRRARGAHWQAVQELPGITVEKDGAQARALLPCPVEETPHVVRRLQVSGTELPEDAPGAPRQGEPLLLCNPNVPMTVGKAAAQVGHATMLLAAELLASGEPDRLRDWAARGYSCSVRRGGTDWARLVESGELVAVHDAGYTEVAPGTITVLAAFA